MKISFSNFFKEISDGFSQLTEVLDSKELQDVEIKLMANFAILFQHIGVVFILLIANIWKIKPLYYLSYSSCYIFFFFLMIYVKKATLSNKVKRHIMCIMVTLQYLGLYFVFYEKISILYWFSLIIVVVPLIVLSTKTIIFYMVGLIFFTAIMSFNNDVIHTLELSIPFIISLYITVTFILMEIALVNKFFVMNNIQKYKRYEQVMEQKVELSGLYQEILATEEELRVKNDELYSIAFIDPLTDIPNKERLMAKLNKLIDQAKPFFLVLLDFDDFKRVNESLGYKTGNLLLKNIAKRLDSVKGDDFVARMGGDEFVCVLEGNFTDERAKVLINRYGIETEKRFFINGYEIDISSCCGVVKYPDDAINVNELIKNADIALYEAKRRGKNQWYFFGNAEKDGVLDKLEIEMYLKKALEKDEMFMVYQPILSTNSEKVRVVEALIRWNSKELGFVPPNKFIPIAEKTGMIEKVGKFVIEEVYKTAEKVNLASKTKICFTINISPLQLKKADFLEYVFSISKKFHKISTCIIFEFTETAFIGDFEYANEVVRELKKAGIKIAIDDFGTGFSSLSYLSMLPVDILKIDKSFIDKMENSIEDLELVKAIISISHIFNMPVIAEGVEYERQVNVLSKESCDFIQGYYYSKPLKEEDLMNYLNLQSIL